MRFANKWGSSPEEVPTVPDGKSSSQLHNYQGTQTPGSRVICNLAQITVPKMPLILYIIHTRYYLHYCQYLEVFYANSYIITLSHSFHE